MSVAFKRYLYHEINKSNRLIAIKGASGTGKTTLLLQLAKEYNSDEVLYVALDNLFFSENTLYGLAEKFAKIGGEIILIDEVHKYPNWSRELKLVYDDFTQLRNKIQDINLKTLSLPPQKQNKKLCLLHLDFSSTTNHLYFLIFNKKQLICNAKKNS